MDLNRVAIFVRVVEEGGFTAAAKALGLPKSSVSRSVALLERELGARLLGRSTRKITPTDAGAAFYERASRGLAVVAEAREAVVDLEVEVRGQIRITASVDAGVWMLAPVIAAFTKLYPAVLVDVSLSARVVDLVEEGFDFALRAGALRDETLVARKLPAVAFALYASRGYLDEHGTPRDIASLAQHRCILFREKSGRATWTFECAGYPESVVVSGAVNTDDFSFAMRAAASGAGIARLPTFVTTEAERDRLVRVLPEHSAPGAPLHLVYASSRYVPRRVAVFRDFLMDALTRPAGAAPATETSTATKKKATKARER